MGQVSRAGHAPGTAAGSGGAARRSEGRARRSPAVRPRCRGDAAGARGGRGDPRPGCGSLPPSLPPSAPRFPLRATGGARGPAASPARPPWEPQAPSPIRAPRRAWRGRPDALTNGIAGPGWAVGVGVATGRVPASLRRGRQSCAEVSAGRSCGGAIPARRDAGQPANVSPWGSGLQPRR